MSTGIGITCPSKKLDIVGFSKFDTMLIKITLWIFRKRNLTITVTNKCKYTEPSFNLFVDGNIGIGV